MKVKWLQITTDQSNDRSIATCAVRTRARVLSSLLMCSLLTLSHARVAQGVREKRDMRKFRRIARLTPNERFPPSALNPMLK